MGLQAEGTAWGYFLLVAAQSRQATSVVLRLRISLIAQPASNYTAATRTILGMTAAFINRYFLKIEGAHAFNTGHIHTILLRVGAALMEGINPAMRTEIMPGLPGVELIKGQSILPLLHLNICQVARHRHRPAHAAIRAIATARRTQAVCQLHIETNGSTMAGRFMHRASIRGVFGHE